MVIGIRAAARKRVIIVDDDPQVRSLVTRTLVEAGCDAISCATFDEGQVAVTSTPADIVIVDIRLCGSNGLQLILRAQEQNPDLRAIAITGFDDADLRREAT